MILRIHLVSSPLAKVVCPTSLLQTPTAATNDPLIPFYFAVAPCK